MANRVGNFLESYDFFGKSLPGIVLFLGFISLHPGPLPVKIFLETGGGISLTAVFTLLISLVFVGLVMGQAVHGLSVNAEKIFYWAGHTAYNIYYEKIADLTEGYLKNNRTLMFLYKYTALRLIWRVSRSWWIRRYWGVHDVFKSHRRLFENTLAWHFDRETDRRQGDKENITYHGLNTAFNQTFSTEPYDSLGDFGIQTEEYDEFRQIYPLVASEVTEKGMNRASGFQARYSFCRGMWVVLSILLISYVTAFGMLPIHPGYSPVIQEFLTGDERLYLLIGLGGSILAFMDASGDYKRNYVEYLISEFYAQHGRSNREDNDEEKEENVYNYYYPPLRRNT